MSLYWQDLNSTYEEMEDYFGFSYKLELDPSQIPDNVKSDLRLRIRKGEDHLEVDYKSEHPKWGLINTAFTLSSFPYNCGICIISNISACKDNLKFALKLCEEMGYSLALYSLVLGGGQQEIEEILIEEGFTFLKESAILNARSGNDIGIFSKQLFPIFPEEDDPFEDDEEEYDEDF
jgi:hypothetical protein